MAIAAVAGGLAFGLTVAIAAAASSKGSVPLVELRGAGRAIGAEHGRRLGAEIRELQSLYLARMIPPGPRRVAARAAGDVFRSHLAPGHRDEVDALAAAAKVDPEDVMLAQCFLDLRPMTACSTIALPEDAAPDGVARLGRNLEFASLGVADKHSVVLAYRPQGRFAFVSIGWPGMIGVVSGINEHGLCIANMEVTRGMRVPRAMPYTLLYRSVLEQCRSVDEAVAFLERTPRQTANNVMLMDEKGARAVVEITPEKVVVRRGAAGAALESTNHQRGKDQDRHGLCRCLHDGAAADYGKIDVARLRSLLGRASLGSMTMQSMIFEPATRTIYLATGKDASHRDFRKIDLRPYLR